MMGRTVKKVVSPKTCFHLCSSRYSHILLYVIEPTTINPIGCKDSCLDARKSWDTIYFLLRHYNFGYSGTEAAYSHWGCGQVDISFVIFDVEKMMWRLTTEARLYNNISSLFSELITHKQTFWLLVMLLFFLSNFFNSKNLTNLTKTYLKFFDHQLLLLFSHCHFVIVKFFLKPSLFTI